MKTLALPRRRLRQRRFSSFHAYDEIVTINVAGELFQTYQTTLAKYPRSLLGNSYKRLQYLNQSTGQYYFDRHSEIFETILYFYQSGGEVCPPNCVPLERLVEELEFFGIGEDYIKEIDLNNNSKKKYEKPASKYLRILWDFLEYPNSSLPAKIFAFFSLSVLLLVITLLVLETIPSFRNKGQVKLNKINETTSFNCTTCTTNVLLEKYQFWAPTINISVIVWFVTEFLLRAIACPNKLRFFMGLRNIIDLLSILPYLLELTFTPTDRPVLGVFRVLRFINILKLPRHSNGIIILGRTIKASSEELLTVGFVFSTSLLLLSSAVYFAEHKLENTKFTSIPHTAWWAIVTLTTTGYGDMTPRSFTGKLISCFALLLGVIMISLPIPTIVTNFSYFYEKEMSRKLAEKNLKMKENKDKKKNKNEKTKKDFQKGAIRKGLVQNLDKISSIDDGWQIASINNKREIWEILEE